MFNETSYGLGEMGDYVKAGDAIGYAVTVKGLENYSSMGGGLYSGIFSVPTGPTPPAVSAIVSGIQSNGFTITKQEVVPSAGSLAFDVKAPTDFRDLNDVKALFDGIVQSSGLTIMGSSHISHSSFNLASPTTLDPTLGKSALQIAGDWWSQALGTTGWADSLGIPKEILIGGAVILGAVLVSSLLRR